MILLLYGPDTYRSVKRLAQLKEGFKKKYNADALSIEPLDGAGLSYEKFHNAVYTTGLFHQRRMSIVSSLFSEGNLSVQKQVLESISAHRVPDTSIVIFWEGDLEHTQKSLGRRKKKEKKEIRGDIRNTCNSINGARIEIFPSLSNLTLHEWVETEIRKRNGSIEKNALLDLVTRVGNDLWRMNQEIEKLIHYSFGRTISRQDVALFVRDALDENMFHFTDALLQKRAERALQLLHEQLMAGTHPTTLIARCAWQFRMLARIHALLEQHIPQQEIAKTLSAHPFVVQKTIPHARAFTEKQSIRIFSDLLALDRALKSTSTDPTLLFDIFVMKSMV